MTDKNLPITSAPEQARIAAAARKKIEPPPHVSLTECDRPFFDNIIAENAAANWSEHQLELAAFLARSMADFVREQDEMRREGALIKTDKGVFKTNPRQAVVQNAAATIMQIRKSLSLHARAQEGEARDVAKRRQYALELQNRISDIDDAENLIASPGL